MTHLLSFIIRNLNINKPRVHEDGAKDAWAN